MKSSCFKFKSLKFKSNPSMGIEIESPHVIKVYFTLTSYNSHIVSQNTCWMICSCFWLFPMDMNLWDSILLQIKLEHIIKLLLARTSSSKDIDMLIVMQHCCVIRPLQTCWKPLRCLESNLLERVRLDAELPKVSQISIRSVSPYHIDSSLGGYHSLTPSLRDQILCLWACILPIHYIVL